MQIATSEDQGPISRVALQGRMDIMGAESIALPLATLAGAKQNLIIDMSGVTFLASIGIRHLVSAAKTLTRRGGRLVLLNATDMVTEVLTTSGLATLLPMVRSESEAIAALGLQGGESDKRVM